MHVVRQDQAPSYEAPGHFSMAMRYLQGRDAGPTNSVWLGLSVIQPGGGTTLVASAVEKFYVVVSGQVEITGQVDGRSRTEILQPLDSCRIDPGEARQLTNRSDQPASVLLVMPEPRAGA
jgi:mannose-6-phosphate isomerase-like protein (cupin superfamily)